ncbi:MAG: peptidoglycan editing factor PgeF [Epsilonproteobacteria bacterium]|nr:peptidoglycan editing factor PgeF [Campylobacterota bacterium]
MNNFKFKNLSSYANIIHKITEKNNAHSCLNSLALHTNEPKEQILINRERLKNEFVNMKFVVANQTHSNHIKVIKEWIELGWSDKESAIDDCDALITNQKNLMLTILTADCVPILLFCPKKNVISAIHAGWKGTLGKIVINAVETMKEEFGVNPKDIVASIAPAIGECCYEVSKEVAQKFDEYHNAYRLTNGSYMLNLPLINQLQLESIGVKNIEQSNICTACENENYFSYRKEGGCSGRFMSMIGLI